MLKITVEWNIVNMLSWIACTFLCRPAKNTCLSSSLSIQDFKINSLSARVDQLAKTVRESDELIEVFIF